MRGLLHIAKTTKGKATHVKDLSFVVAARRQGSVGLTHVQPGCWAYSIIASGQNDADGW